VHGSLHWCTESNYNSIRAQEALGYGDVVSGEHTTTADYWLVGDQALADPRTVVPTQPKLVVVVPLESSRAKPT
jgi:hypothetical protein